MSSLYQNYEWGFTRTPPIKDQKHVIKYQPTNWNRLLEKPSVKLRLVDEGRSYEVDTFYKLSQQHREQYASYTGKIHPLRFFRKSNVLWQCAPDYTGTYLDFPQYHVQYKHPIVLPRTYNRTLNVPRLPERNLAGRYNYGTDTRYRR